MNIKMQKKSLYWLHFRAVKFGRRIKQAHLSSTWTWFLYQGSPQLSRLLTASLVSILPANNECSDWIVKSRTWASIPVVITGWVITLAEAHLYLTVAVALKQISFAHRRFLSLKVTELLAQNQASRGAAELWHQLTMKTLTAVIFVEDCAEPRIGRSSRLVNRKSLINCRQVIGRNWKENNQKASEEVKCLTVILENLTELQRTLETVGGEQKIWNAVKIPLRHHLAPSGASLVIFKKSEPQKNTNACFLLTKKVTHSD